MNRNEYNVYRSFVKHLKGYIENPNARKGAIFTIAINASVDHKIKTHNLLVSNGFKPYYIGVDGHLFDDEFRIQYNANLNSYITDGNIKWIEKHFINVENPEMKCDHYFIYDCNPLTTDTTDTTDTRKIKVTMFAGLNDGKTGVQIIPTNTAKQIIAEIACKYSNGATISECCGVWKTESHLEIETSFRIEMLDFPLVNVESMVNELKIALNQNSIAVEKGLIKSKFM